MRQYAHVVKVLFALPPQSPPTSKRAFKDAECRSSPKLMVKRRQITAAQMDEDITNQKITDKPAGND